MHRLPLLAAVVLVALTGCLEPQPDRPTPDTPVDPPPIQPGPSTGSWTETDANPWFAYEANGGFCGPVCYAAAVVHEDGSTLWVTWGHINGSGESGPGNVTSGTQPTMRADDERYRGAVRDALGFMAVDADVRVYDVVTKTMPSEDVGRIRERILANANAATDPGNVTYTCTDVGASRVVVDADEDWNVHVAGRDDGCVRLENPQAEWFIVHDQGVAIWRWIHQEHWMTP